MLLLWLFFVIVLGGYFLERRYRYQITLQKILYISLFVYQQYHLSQFINSVRMVACVHVQFVIILFIFIKEDKQAYESAIFLFFYFFDSSIVNKFFVLLVYIFYIYISVQPPT